MRGLETECHHYRWLKKLVGGVGGTAAAQRFSMAHR